MRGVSHTSGASGGLSTRRRGVWLKSDKSNASFFEPLYDLWSYVSFLFSQWRWSKPESGNLALIIVALAPLLVYALFRLLALAKDSSGVKNKKKKPSGAKSLQGLDSPFYMVEERMSDLGFARHPHETFFSWQDRISKNNNLHPAFADVRPMILLHYRYRFDPVGLPDVEKKKTGKRCPGLVKKAHGKK